MARGILTVDEIRAQIDDGEVDRPVGFHRPPGAPDGQTGLTGDYFINDILAGEGAVHACNYLIANDMEMEPVPGYAYASWETGYGDLKAVPEWNTLRRIPWLEKTALVICDTLDEETGEEIAVSPRRS